MSGSDDAMSLDDARANARTVHRAWRDELARLTALAITPEYARTSGTLDEIDDNLYEAQLSLERLEAMRDAMEATVRRMRVALGTSENP